MSEKPRRRRNPATSEDALTSAAQAVSLIGVRMRELRVAKSMTLQQLSAISNLSPSMLSLIERGRATPSIGSLLLIANALGVAIADLIPAGIDPEEPVVSRAQSLPSGQSSGKLLRRILRQDNRHGLLVSLTEYRPNTGTSLVEKAHSGYEHGFVIEGEIEVEFEGRKIDLGPGDMISYSSHRRHRIWNHKKKLAKALWINIYKE